MFIKTFFVTNWNVYGVNPVTSTPIGDEYNTIRKHSIWECFVGHVAGTDFGINGECVG